MPTINQLCNQIRQLKKRLVRTPALENSPQRKGTVSYTHLTLPTNREV